MLNDQQRHELRGMLVHLLRLTPAAAAAKATELEKKSAAGTAELLDQLRGVENELRASLQTKIDVLVSQPDAPANPEAPNPTP